jgi:hypothetical protein
MRCIRWILILLLGCTASADAAAQAPEVFPNSLRVALHHADVLEGLVLDPQQAPIKEMADFHGWRVTKTQAIVADARRRVIDALVAGVNEYSGAPERCFIPHHGLHVVYQQHVFDFVICFQCHQIHVYVEGQESVLLISDTPNATFEELVDRGALPR